MIENKEVLDVVNGNKYMSKELLNELVSKLKFKEDVLLKLKVVAGETLLGPKNKKDLLDVVKNEITATSEEIEFIKLLLSDVMDIGLTDKIIT